MPTNKGDELPKRLPKMIVFDLDYTVWPTWIDCSYGPPFKYDEKNNVVIDKAGEALPLFKDIPAVFALIKSMPDTKIGIASRTCTPDWALKLLKLFRIPELDNATMYEVIDHFEIYPSSKIKHFNALSQKTGIPCNEMLFFDDEWRNSEVKTALGVHFVHVDTRDGVTMYKFMNALRMFAKEAQYTQSTLNFGK